MNWQTELAASKRSLESLAAELELNIEDFPQAVKACKEFPLRVPQSYLNKMRKGDLNDPLLLQVLPQAQERIEQAGFSQDPLQEEQANPIPGLLHKYHNRVLLITTGACAIHCRYCFRRHFPYEENNPGKAGWEKAMAYIREHREIDEVILSGGDPLAMADKPLAFLLDAIQAIPHIKRIRLHTRLPIVMPNRITPELINLFKANRCQMILVVHSNHAQELENDVKHALAKLHRAHITLFNQTVLLKGINDNADTLADLSQSLFEQNVQPYYLHLLDPVAGAAHFDVSLPHAKKIYHQLQSKLSGYLVPKLVREVPELRYKKIQSD